MSSTKTGNSEAQRIFHVSSRESIQGLRDEILRLHGYAVQSSLFSDQIPGQLRDQDFDLVLIDVESDGRVDSAQELCDSIRKVLPEQHVAFVCNHRIAIESDCPDEIIRAEFNPEALVRGVKHALGN